MMETNFRLNWLGVMGASMAFFLANAAAQPKGDKGKGGGPPAAAQKGKPSAGKAKADKKPAGPGKADQGRQAAQEKGKARSDKSPAHPGKAKARFGKGDRERITAYFSEYRNEKHGLPPGLAKNLRRGKPLPPGWQKKISTGYIIEDEWWPDFQPVPHKWFPDLPVIPETGMYRYGNRIVRVYEPGREILDVLTIPTIREDW